MKPVSDWDWQPWLSTAVESEQEADLEAWNKAAGSWQVNCSKILVQCGNEYDMLSSTSHEKWRMYSVPFPWGGDANGSPTLAKKLVRGNYVTKVLAAFEGMGNWKRWTRGTSKLVGSKYVEYSMVRMSGSKIPCCWIRRLSVMWCRWHCFQVSLHMKPNPESKLFRLKRETTW